MQFPFVQTVHGHTYRCPCCALASPGARTQTPARCWPWLPCGSTGQAGPLAALHSCKGLSSSLFVTGGKKVWPPSTRTLSASALCFWLAGPGPQGRQAQGLVVLQVLGKGTVGIWESRSRGIGNTHLFLPLWGLVDRCHICRIPRPSWGGVHLTCVHGRPVCSWDLEPHPDPVTYVRQPGPDLLQWAIGKATSLCPRLPCSPPGLELCCIITVLQRGSCIG